MSIDKAYKFIFDENYLLSHAVDFVIQICYHIYK